MKYLLMGDDSGEKKKESPKDKVGGKGKKEVGVRKREVRYDQNVT